MEQREDMVSSAAGVSVMLMPREIACTQHQAVDDIGCLAVVAEMTSDPNEAKWSDS